MGTFLRLLVAAGLAYGQNPLARPADPFAGTYQNKEMKVELTRQGAEYAGAILLGGQSLPVKAKAANGALSGTFESQGQSYKFQAKRNGTQLTLTTDGVTHTLEKAEAGAPAPVAPVPAAAAPAVVASPLIGDWQSPRGIVKINADGTAVIGDKTHRWKEEAGTVVFTGNGETLRVPYDLVGDVWTWKFTDGRMPLTRVTGAAAAGAGDITGAWQGQNGSVQLNPDGSAVVAGVMYRYSRNGNQLTLAGPDGTFVATVNVMGDSMTWLINGKTLAFQKAMGTWALGSARAGGILPELIGKWCKMSTLNNSTGVSGGSVCFSLLADGSYLYAAESGATGQVSGGAYGTASENSDVGTWTATADTITAVSKKTGTRTFRLEKRNHPKTGDPMLVLDGEEFTTAFQKAPWR